MNGALTLGHLVPSITALSQELGHARPTLTSKALQLLVQEERLSQVPVLGYHYVAGNLIRPC